MSVHANVAVPPRDRARLERLCRYVARPPLATQRMEWLPDGRLLYHRWRDGTTHVLFEPLELMERLAALVPPPRFNLVRYHGVLAPAAARRAQVVPATPASTAPGHPCGGGSATPRLFPSPLGVVGQFRRGRGYQRPIPDTGLLQERGKFA